MASRRKAELESLLAGYQRAQADPRLYQILKALLDQVNGLVDDITPIIIATEAGEVTVGTLPDVPSFTYTLLPYSVKLEWTKPSEDIQFFEIRKGSGTWETSAFVLATKSLQANIEPLTVGSHTYQIRATNPGGNYSTNSTTVTVIVPSLGSPSVTSQVIDNNVLLSWSAVTSVFQIKEYILKKDGTEIGRQTGTFAVIFESSAGTFDYRIEPVDIAGNIGPFGEVSVTVSTPKDYVLKDVGIDSLFDGTRTNAYKDSTPCIFVPVDTAETWQSHFTSRGWSTPQNQIDAGFPYFLQPTLQTARYVKVFDYGAIFSNVLATVSQSLIQIVSTVSVSIQLRYSDDLIVWSTPVVSSSVFAPSLRYLEVQLDFTASS